MSGGSPRSLTDARADLLAGYRAALAAVDGERCVRRYLADHPLPGPLQVAAVGKAAYAMTSGARAALGGRLQRALLISRAGHRTANWVPDPRIECREAGHPLPDAGSLAAGQALLRFLAGLPEDSGLLVLLSGGASSLVEVLPGTVTLDTLQAANRWLLASGLPIADVNRVRCALSRIKGGRLRRFLGSRAAVVLLVSDVAGDDPAFIGSGLLCPGGARGAAALPLPDWLARVVAAGTDEPCTGGPPIEHHVIARLADALQAAARRAGELGYPVTVVDDRLAGEAAPAGEEIAAWLRDRPFGAYLWGGETTVTLPASPGRGGRCQQFALAAARRLAGNRRVVLLAAGTDGCDGTGPAAGALVDGDTLARGRARGLDASHCLRRADAGTYLQATGDLVTTGPTGTNVTDLVMAIVADAPA